MKILQRFRRDQSKLRLPTAIADGITQGEGGTWAWVLIPDRATDNLNTATILRMTSDGSSDLRRLIPSGAEFQVKIQWGRWSGEDYRHEEARPGMRPESVEFVELGAESIDQRRYARRMVLLGVRMDGGGSVAGAAAAKAGKVFGTTTLTRDAESAVANTMKRVGAFQERMRYSSFGARPATAQELAWSLRRDLRRTVDWVPATSVVTGGQMVRLKVTQVDPEVDHMKLTTDTGTRYVRLVVPAEGGFPATDMELPGGEWLKDLNIVRQDDDDEDDESAPVEVSVRGRNVPQVEAVKKLRAAIKLTKEQHREARLGMAGEAPDAVTESQDVLRTRLREVEQGQVGMIEDAPVWIVEAASLEQLDSRTDALIQRYGGMGITLWSPPSLQDLLWKETVIGEARRVDDFTQFRPVPTLVGAWFHGGSAVGARRGPYLGGNIGSTPGPFRNRLSDAQLNDETVTTCFLGRSRSGKSTAVMLSLLGEVVLADAWGGLADLKGDLRGIIAAARRYGAPVTAVLIEEQPSGAMCPYRYIVDAQRATDYAIDNLVLLLPLGRGRAAEAQIRSAGLQVRDLPVEQRSTWAIIEILCASEDPVAHGLGEELRDLAQSSLASCVVGKPGAETISLPTTAGLCYLGLEALEWPGRETAPEKWTPSNRVSMVVAKSAMSYLTYMSSRVRGIPKIVALTELHRLTRYDFGRDFVGDLARTGAALDTNLLLDTQACVELLSIDGLEDQISQVHAFRAQSDAEADAQAVLLGLEPEESIRATQHGWRPGQCLTRDRQGRIAPVQFDYMSTELQTLLSTTPKRDQPPPQTRDSDVHPTALTKEDRWPADDDMEESA